MAHKEVDKKIKADLCEKCPARNGQIFGAHLRGSSFRGRFIEQNEKFESVLNTISVGDIAVARVIIANQEDASSAQDNEVITSIFEEKIVDCKGPELELVAKGLESFCYAINKAVDEFILINY